MLPTFLKFFWLEATDYGLEHLINTQGRASMNVVRKMSGPPPEITQDTTQTKGTHTHSLSIGIKISDPAGNRTPVSALDGTFSIRVIDNYLQFFLHSQLY